MAFKTGVELLVNAMFLCSFKHLRLKTNNSDGKKTDIKCIITRRARVNE